MKICYIGSGGGHLFQLIQLNRKLKITSCFFVSNKSEQIESLSNLYLIYSLPEPYRNPFIHFYIFLESLKIFIKERPTTIITTGAGIAFHLCLIGRIFGCKILFIEDFCRISKPSLFGKIIYLFASKTFIQWKELKKYYPSSIFIGPIIDLNGTRKFKNNHRIFIVMGSYKIGMTRLIIEIDKIVDKLSEYHFEAQTGNINYHVSNFKNSPYLPQSLFNKKMNYSSIIISHGGIATLLKAIQKGKYVIAFPRKKKFGESIDDHQQDIINALRKLNLLVELKNISDIYKIIKEIPKSKIYNITGFNSSSKNIIYKYIK